MLLIIYAWIINIINCLDTLALSYLWSSSGGMFDPVRDALLNDPSQTGNSGGRDGSPEPSHEPSEKKDTEKLYDYLKPSKGRLKGEGNPKLRLINKGHYERSLKEIDKARIFQAIKREESILPGTTRAKIRLTSTLLDSIKSLNKNYP